jgi:hypothetical protein
MLVADDKNDVVIRQRIHLVQDMADNGVARDAQQRFRPAPGMRPHARAIPGK